MTSTQLRTYQANMSGWVQALNESGIDLALGELKEDRLTEIEALQKSGLPTYDYHLFMFEDFLSHPETLQNLYRRYEGQVVVRAASLGGRHQRLTLIGKDWDACRDVFLKSIPAALSDVYRVIVNEYDPARFCGVVISAPEGLVIEMIEEPNLENLSHGRVTPWQGFFAPVFGAGCPTMTYAPGVAAEIRSRMWQVVRRLSAEISNQGALPHFVPQVGDFEFVFSRRNDALRFIDCKNVWWKFGLLDRREGGKRENLALNRYAKVAEKGDHEWAKKEMDKTEVLARFL